MNDRYDFSSKKNVAWRKQWAEKAGCGFDLPLQLGLVGPIGPKVGPKAADGKGTVSEVAAVA
jgi:hypothetical protein